MGVAGNVAVIGAGLTKFGENFHLSYMDMIVEAAHEALADAALGPEAIEAAWLGTCYPDDSGYEGHTGASLADALGLSPRPVTRVTNLCATGMDAVRNAAFSLAAGEFGCVLVVGAEKMRDVSARETLVARHVERTHPLLCKGRTAPGQFALLATRYLAAHGLDRRVLAEVAVKNHANGALNPKAHLQRPVSLQQVLDAPMVAEPLGLLDCCPTTDGAAAVLLAPRELAERRGRPFALIRGIGLGTHASQFTVPYRPDDFLGFPATQAAARAAYGQAGIADPAAEIQVAEVHDCFTITEILNYEDLGLAPRGQGWRLITEGVTTLKGSLPINPSGGLKSFGHPIGATGVRMVAEVYAQVTARAGKRQVAGATRGLAHTLGGPGVVACVAILEGG
jgi:acetyl-CoA C-acetyltransferase